MSSTVGSPQSTARVGQGEPIGAGGGPRVAVVGGGIAGLVAARRIADAGGTAIVVEAGSRLGGQVHTREIAGLAVDVGAESLLLSAPSVRALIDELDLEDSLVSARSGVSLLRCGRRLRRLPAGVGPAGPTRLRPLATAGILSPWGLLRAGLEPLVPRGDGSAGDPAVGALLSRRFGRQVVDRLVEPLLGGLHAADVDRLSAAAATPTLTATLARGRSLLAAPRGAGAGPTFATLPGGLAGLVARLAAHPRIELRLATPVRGVVPTPAGYRVESDGGPHVEVDAVVLAAPAAATRRLVSDLAPTAASPLAAARTAGVATVVAAYPAPARQHRALADVNGLLVPSASGLLLKAATFLSTKWPHLATQPAFLVRLSCGRIHDQRFAALDDDELLAHLHRELASMVALPEPPTEAIVQRWPATMPQLEVGHLQRVREVRDGLADHPRIQLAGAAFDGVGVHAAISSGRDAADALLADPHLSEDAA